MDQELSKDPPRHFLRFPWLLLYGLVGMVDHNATGMEEHWG